MRVGHRSGCRDAERGSVLALVPAAFLVLIILGALAVDSAAAYLGQRRLTDTIAAAANDAASAALSNQNFYRGGKVQLDPAVAAEVVCQSINAQASRQLNDVRVSMAVDGAAIRVHASATVDAVFGRSLPGMARRRVQADTAAVAGGSEAAINDTPAIATSDLRPITC